ncbi:MAG: AI-2E family transporter [Bradyrhizobium sp.]
MPTAGRLLGNPGERLVRKIAAAIRATVSGTLAAAIAKGAVIGIAYVVTGVPHPLLFAVLTTTLAMVPLPGGQRQRSYRSSPLFQMIKSRALTILNFGHASDFAWMTRRRMRLPIMSAEHFLLLGVQVSLALFQHECSHNPDRLLNKAISCHLRARHARIFPSGEPAPAGCVGSLSWRVPMCGRHQQLDATEHTFSFLETA